MERILTAQFASRCSAGCGVRIQPGDQISHDKATGSRHVTCPTLEAAPASPRAREAAPSLVDAPFCVYEKWDPCKREHLRNAAGNTRLYAKRGPDVRQTRKAAEDAAALAGTAGYAEPERGPVGCYMVVGQTGYYETRERNEDCGDMSGPGWQMTLYLRLATEEETARDAVERWEADRPRRERVAREAREEVLVADARAAWLAACSSTVTPEARAAFVPRPQDGAYYTDHPEAIDQRLGSVECGMHVTSYLTEAEAADRAASLTDLWQGVSYRHGDWTTTGSYLRSWVYQGQIVLESYHHNYDMDTSVRLAGCPALLALVRGRDEERRAKDEAAAKLRRRVREGDVPLLRQQFIADLTRLGQLAEPTTAYADKPLPADWTLLRDEILALAEAAFAAPGDGAGELVQLLYSATIYTHSGERHEASPRYIYEEWKKIPEKRAASQRQEAERAEREEQTRLRTVRDTLFARLAAEIGPRWRAWVRAAWAPGALDASLPTAPDSADVEMVASLAGIELLDPGVGSEHRVYVWRGVTFTENDRAALLRARDELGEKGLAKITPAKRAA